IKKKFITKTKIRKFTFSYGIIIRGHEIDKILKGLIIKNYVIAQYKLHNNQKYMTYDITEKGKDFLIELKQKNNNEKQEGK
ncbi:unnamed protein product, partial [marine sediment metagenome]